MKKKPSKKPAASANAKYFDKDKLDKTVIAIPLLDRIREERESPGQYKDKYPQDKDPNHHHVIIDLNLRYSGPDAEAGKRRGRQPGRYAHQ